VPIYRTRVALTKKGIRYTPGQLVDLPRSASGLLARRTAVRDIPVTDLEPDSWARIEAEAVGLDHVTEYASEPIVEPVSLRSVLVEIANDRDRQVKLLERALTRRTKRTKDEDNEPPAIRAFGIERFVGKLKRRRVGKPKRPYNWTEILFELDGQPEFYKDNLFTFGQRHFDIAKWSDIPQLGKELTGHKLKDWKAYCGRIKTSFSRWRDR
jgi:hypothetical protein